MDYQEVSEKKMSVEKHIEENRCPHCGGSVNDGFTRCVNCGSKLVYEKRSYLWIAAPITGCAVLAIIVILFVWYIIDRLFLETINHAF